MKFGEGRSKDGKNQMVTSFDVFSAGVASGYLLAKQTARISLGNYYSCIYLGNTGRMLCVYECL